jgi:serine/threonine protein kinase
MNILHRDLKPANIFLHNGDVKLGDFGFCKSMEKPKDLTQTMVGSPIYMAPEVLFGKSYNNKADVWSLGCVLYEMLYGECPFEEKTMANLINSVEHNDVKFPSSVVVSDRTIQILTKILIKDPEKRIGWKELCEYELS